MPNKLEQALLCGNLEKVKKLYKPGKMCDEIHALKSKNIEVIKWFNENIKTFSKHCLGIVTKTKCNTNILDYLYNIHTDSYNYVYRHNITDINVYKWVHIKYGCNEYCIHDSLNLQYTVDRENLIKWLYNNKCNCNINNFDFVNILLTLSESFINWVIDKYHYGKLPDLDHSYIYCQNYCRIETVNQLEIVNKFYPLNNLSRIQLNKFSNVYHSNYNNIKYIKFFRNLNIPYPRDIFKYNNRFKLESFRYIYYDSLVNGIKLYINLTGFNADIIKFLVDKTDLHGNYIDLHKYSLSYFYSYSFDVELFKVLYRNKICVLDNILLRFIKNNINKKIYNIDTTLYNLFMYLWKIDPDKLCIIINKLNNNVQVDRNRDIIQFLYKSRDYHVELSKLYDKCKQTNII